MLDVDGRVWPRGEETGTVLVLVLIFVFCICNLLTLVSNTTTHRHAAKTVFSVSDSSKLKRKCLEIPLGGRLSGTDSG